MSWQRNAQPSTCRPHPITARAKSSCGPTRLLHRLQRRQLHQQAQNVLLLGLLLSLGGCKAFSSDPTPPVTTNLGPFGVIKFVCGDSDETRAEITAHNNAYLSLKNQKLIEEKDTCPRRTPKPAGKPATS